MKNVKMIKNRIKGRRKVIMIVVVGLFILLIASISLHQLKIYKDKKALKIAKQINDNNRKEMYKEFEDLFYKNEELIQAVNTELNKEVSLKEKEYVILLENFIQSGKVNHDRIDIGFENSVFICDSNQELIDTLNVNEDLKQSFNELKLSGMFYKLSVSGVKNEEERWFSVNTEYTPFITDNNKILNYFIYKPNGDAEIYGYKKIKEDWFMYIPGRPE